jgi:hypothetical protein
MTIMTVLSVGEIGDLLLEAAGRTSTTNASLTTPAVMCGVATVSEVRVIDSWLCLESIWASRAHSAPAYSES